MNKKRNIALGIDIGRVIINGDSKSNNDTSFIQENNMEKIVETSAMADCFDSIKELVKIFEHRVWLVSKAYPNTQRKTIAWLEANKFFEKTGVNRGNIVFCLERSEKAKYCKEHSLTHFIDDRIDVLNYISSETNHCFLFGKQKVDIQIPSWAQWGSNWLEILKLVKESL
tara:strand:- start:37139 stop:37648 length:510 start_codon:yes stop_codon:yes gene_type:complete